MSAVEDHAVTLVDLRRDNQQLRERLAAAEHELLLERQPWRRFMQATESELVKLIDIARGMHPRLIPAADQNFLQAIVVCFTFLTTVGRLEHVDETHYLDHFTDRCVDWARSFTAPIGPIDNRTLFAAAIMHSDIPYRLGTSSAAAQRPQIIAISALRDLMPMAGQPAILVNKRLLLSHSLVVPDRCVTIYLEAQGNAWECRGTAETRTAGSIASPRPC